MPATHLEGLGYRSRPNIVRERHHQGASGWGEIIGYYLMTNCGRPIALGDSPRPKNWTGHDKPAVDAGNVVAADDFRRLPDVDCSVCKGGAVSRRGTMQREDELSMERSCDVAVSAGFWIEIVPEPLGVKISNESQHLARSVEDLALIEEAVRHAGDIVRSIRNIRARDKRTVAEKVVALNATPQGVEEDAEG